MAGLASAEQLLGQALSFNNTFDADLAWQAVSDFTSTCVAIVKHGNLCGLSLGDSVAGHGSPWDYDRQVPILFWWQGAASQN